jgi:hypothetical protein
MTTRERDKLAKRIAEDIMRDLELNSDLCMEHGSYWDEDNPDDQQETQKRWEIIVRKLIPVTVKRDGGNEKK